ncbi:hypothetical protein QIS99_05365 [Streptomyces sp. B-S-A8]|uniref:DUF3618 domain-containing protein n=1 Tax=Streptomyces solicavernae TaxID=3043614 RepID=A0ABT6RMK0_9ACTN|nr:hypothetical protein [Streptomyces sp. B-S-A8]MDI3385648.1 hypothetical protein [Streptomyces sp. B-S-A8]
MAANEDRDAGGPAGGGVHISQVQGAFAVGNDNSVVNQQAGVPPRDPAQEELLRAVRELRGDLARLVQSEETAALDAELADAQGEIEQSGQAGPGRLARLRQALADAGAVTGLVASAVAVSQAVGVLVGG